MRISFAFETENAISGLIPKLQEAYPSNTKSDQTGIYGSVPDEMEEAQTEKADNPDMMVGWEYFDVFSINCYDFDPSTDMDFVKNAGVDLPILLGEYHCGALDRGLPATGLKGIKNQKERARMWRYYVEHAAAHPCGVGAHWFQYNDQFCLGRFDGENYQIGMVDVCMQPYPELLDAVKKSSEALYAVKNGEQKPFDEEPVSIPMIGY